jgi:flavodoxin
MAKVLIAYMSKTGTTEKMAEYVAEGVRIAGQEPEVRNISLIKEEKELAGYGAYIFGCPTYYLDMPQSFEPFLEMARKANLKGKVGGAFSPRAHPSSGGGGAAEQVFQKMESGLEMKMTSLGPFDVEADKIGETELMRSCQEYGKAIGKML